MSKNLYITKLDDIIDKYNNTYHSKIKMKPVDGNLAHMLNLLKNII